MKKKTGKLSKTIALALALLMCAGCGRAGEEAETETAPAAIQPTATQAPSPTEVPATLTPTPSPVPTQVPLKDLKYVRPSFANVVSGATSQTDERGSFVVTNNTLVVLLPTNSHDGYKWNCADNYEDGIFTVSDGNTEDIPYTYTSGKYGGAETPKSEVKAAEEAYRQSLREEPNAEAASDTTDAATETGNEDGGAGEDEIIEEIIIYEDDPDYEEYVDEGEEYEIVEGDESVYEEEIPDEQQEEVGNEDIIVEEQSFAGGNMSVSLMKASGPARPSFKMSGPSGGIRALAAEGDASVPEETTYVYAPSRTEYVFTPQSAGTGIFYLECTKGDGTASVLDNGFILFAHADENLDITFDLAWYSFADCVAAPERIPEYDASVLTEQVAAQEKAAGEAFDSCVRNDNTIGAASRMVDDSYWEVFSMDNAVADITSNGGAFFHEDFVDYSWDLFTINPHQPGRTTAYFIHMTGDNSSVPRTQVADIHVADDMSVTVHVRRLDMGVQFD